MSDPLGGRPRAINSFFSWSTPELTLLGLSLLSVAASCVVISAKKYFWADELFSWTLVTDPSVRHLLYALWHGADGAPPLYYFTTRIWTAVFGRSELGFRSASAAGFMIALTATWTTLRRAFGRFPAAVATLFVFMLSSLVLHQIAEARFYGLLTALVAIAVYLHSRAVLQESLSPRLLLAIGVTHLALVYSHVYGLLYSGAILFAWITSDRLSNRRWHSGYLTILLAWAAFLPWLPAIRASADVGYPHSWIAVPTIRDLIDAYSFSLRGTAIVFSAILVLGALTPNRALEGESLCSSQPRRLLWWRARRIAIAVLIVLSCLAGVLSSPIRVWNLRRVGRAFFLPSHTGLILLVLLGFILVQLASRFVRRKRETAAIARTISPRNALLLVGMSLQGILVVSFITSHIATSIFSPRYFIPASLGLAPAVAYFIEWSCGKQLMAVESALIPSFTDGLVPLGWTVLVALLVVLPVLHAAHAPARKRLGIEVETVAPAHAYVVVESELDLLPLRHYQRRHDITYVYPMDWAAANTASELSATVEYKLMAIWKHVGYADSSMLSGAHVPCERARFIALNSLRNAWFDERVLSDPSLEAAQIGTSQPPLHPFVIYLVDRRGSDIPVACRSNMSSGLMQRRAEVRNYHLTSFIRSDHSRSVR